MVSTAIDSFLSASVASFARTDIPRIAPTASLDDVGKAYRSTSLNCLFVVEPTTGKLLGILDDNAISRISSVKGETAADLLKIANTGPLIAVPSDAQMWEALKVMNGENSEARRYDSLPVVDATSHLPLGVITRNDLDAKAVKYSSSSS
jgi:CBS domain-containing protein